MFVVRSPKRTSFCILELPLRALTSQDAKKIQADCSVRPTLVVGLAAVRCSTDISVAAVMTPHPQRAGRQKEKRVLE